MSIPVIALWTGQGAQKPGMGIHEAQGSPEFAAHWNRLHALYHHISGDDILTVITEGQDQIHQTRYAQPALCIYELAQGYVRTDTCHITAHIGHSVGEYAAAIFAQVMSEEEGLWLLYHRARLMQSCPVNTTGMCALMCNESEAQSLLVEYPEIDIAGINHQKQTCISGPCDSLARLLESKSIRGIRLPVSHGFHSRAMAPIIDEFRSYASQVSYLAAQQPLYNNITGDEKTHFDSDYWCQQIISPVRFLDCVTSASHHQSCTFVEFGPQETLSRMIKKINPLLCTQY